MKIAGAELTIPPTSWS